MDFIKNLKDIKEMIVKQKRQRDRQADRDRDREGDRIREKNIEIIALRNVPKFNSTLMVKLWENRHLHTALTV